MRKNISYNIVNFCFMQKSNSDTLTPKNDQILTIKLLVRSFIGEKINSIFNPKLHKGNKTDTVLFIARCLSHACYKTGLKNTSFCYK